MLPLTAPATPGPLSPAPEEQDPLSEHTPSESHEKIHAVTPSGEQSFRSQKPTNTRIAPSIPDTPRSLTPESKKEAIMPTSVPASHSECLPEAAPHAGLTWTEAKTLANILSKNEAQHKPVLIDFERLIGLAEVVAVAK